jgi:hypothetical protein
MVNLVVWAVTPCLSLGVPGSAGAQASSPEGPHSPAGLRPTVRIQVDTARVGMGRTVKLDATATFPDGRPAAGSLLLPSVDGKRWGAHEFADDRGRARFLLPLPRPGIAEIRVEALPPKEKWIWAPRMADNQRIWIQRAFDLAGKPATAKLWVGIDDAAEVFVNGQSVGKFNGWNAAGPVPNVTGLLKSGRNVISVEAFNGKVPAGFLLRLEADTPSGPVVVASGLDWQCHATRPASWPQETAQRGEAVVALTALQEAVYTGSMGQWPNAGRDRLLTGTRVPEGANLSNSVAVQVDWRRLAVMPSDPEHLVGAQYCSLYAPHGFDWATAQAVPLVGFYRSWDPDVLRQHLIWLTESGVDFLLADWSNQLWDRQHWDDRTDAANEVVHTTTMLLEAEATMRDQGLPVPRVVIFVGLNNGPSTTMTAINEESTWIYHNYMRNPRFHDLFVEYLGKPLLLVFNGSGPGWLKDTKQVPVDDRHFTIRWMSSQHQLCHHNENGYWTWMDGSLRQPVTLLQGKPEVVTVSAAFFDSGGWTGPTAHGRRGGWTYVESFKGALKSRPRFLQLHQFQEFAGAPEGSQPFYGDSYSVELSDDIEPVSLTTPAYRGDGGWGFHFLNLTRALVDLYRQKTPATTVLAIARPDRGSTLNGDRVPVQWTWAGKTPRSFTIALNGTPVARGLSGAEATIDLGPLKDGPVVLRLTAEGTEARYPMSFTDESLPQAAMAPAFAEVQVVRKRGNIGRTP